MNNQMDFRKIKIRVLFHEIYRIDLGKFEIPFESSCTQQK